jgi:hypothetical protein
LSRLKPDTAWRRIVMDARLPARARIMALQQITRPSFEPPTQVVIPKNHAAATAITCGLEVCGSDCREGIAKSTWVFRGRASWLRQRGRTADCRTV